MPRVHAVIGLTTKKLKRPDRELWLHSNNIWPLSHAVLLTRYFPPSNDDACAVTDRMLFVAEVYGSALSRDHVVFGAALTSAADH